MPSAAIVRGAGVCAVLMTILSLPAVFAGMDGVAELESFQAFLGTDAVKTVALLDMFSRVLFILALLVLRRLLPENLHRLTRWVIGINGFVIVQLIVTHYVPDFSNFVNILAFLLLLPIAIMFVWFGVRLYRSPDDSVRPFRPFGLGLALTGSLAPFMLALSIVLQILGTVFQADVMQMAESMASYLSVILPLIATLMYVALAIGFFQVAGRNGSAGNGEASSAA